MDELESLIMPDGEQVKSTLTYLDIVLKCQALLYEFHSIMYWMSLSEIILLILLLIFFLRSPGQMWFAFLHAPHLVRGILGFKINNAVPRSYDIVDKLKPEEGSEGS